MAKKAHIDSGFSCVALNKFFREKDFERFNDTYKDLVKEVEKLQPLVCRNLVCGHILILGLVS